MSGGGAFLFGKSFNSGGASEDKGYSLGYEDIGSGRYRIRVMPYGVATCPWVTDGKRVYAFGGEPAHGYNENTENVFQIGTLVRKQ